MDSQAESRVGVVLSALLFVAVAAASYPLLSSGGLVYRTISLDFGPVAPWFAVGRRCWFSAGSQLLSV